MGVGDVKFKERLCFEAGYSYVGAGLRRYLEELFPPSAQERFLTGYCCRLAESDPGKAVSEYKALRPEKVSYYGLLEVAGYMDPEADFPKVDVHFPDDHDEANNMGAELRRRMLERWAAFHPEAAARYVLDTPKRVKPATIGVVITKWAETSPDTAAEWLGNAPAGKAKDEGLATLVKHWTDGGDPVKA